MMAVIGASCTGWRGADRTGRSRLRRGL